jgi:hypothetical protein
MYKLFSVRLTKDFSLATMQARVIGMIIQVLKRKPLIQKSYIMENYLWKMEVK